MTLPTNCDREVPSGGKKKKKKKKKTRREKNVGRY